MKKTILILVVLFTISTLLCSCTLLQKPLDKRSGFSKYLKETEDSIRVQNWTNANNSLESAQKIWKQLKPILQLDIDHDYVNDIEDDFTRLKGYIESQDKPDSLATVLLIQENWKNIGSM